MVDLCYHGLSITFFCLFYVVKPWLIFVRAEIAIVSLLVKKPFLPHKKKKNHALLNPNYDITFKIIQIMKQSQNYDILSHSMRYKKKS